MKYRGPIAVWFFHFFEKVFVKCEPAHQTGIAMKISAIKLGRRHRTDVGDVRSLATSVERLGFLHPVVVDGKGRLVAGARRLAAVKLLEWRDVPARVVRSLSDAAQALRAERDESVERRDFLPSEQVHITRALEPLERAEAKARQGTGTDRHRWQITTKFNRQDSRQGGCCCCRGITCAFVDR